MNFPDFSEKEIEQIKMNQWVLSCALGRVQEDMALIIETIRKINVLLTDITNPPDKEE